MSEKARDRSPLRVFISSTYLDNVERRRLVENAVLQADMHPVGMERFTAGSQPAVAECERLAAECDLYIGIVAHRYGWIPEGHSVSITELEYDAAKRAGRACYVFFIEEDVRVDPSSDFDEDADRWDKQKLLSAFRAKCSKDQLPARFHDNTLQAKVLEALYRWRQENESTDERSSIVEWRAEPLTRSADSWSVRLGQVAAVRRDSAAGSVVPAGYRPYPRALIEKLDELTGDRARRSGRDEVLEQRIRELVHEIATEYRPATVGDVVLGASLIEVIGSGGFGDVWRARPLGGTPRDDIAIKIFQSAKLGLARNLHAFRVGVAAMERLAEDASRPPEVIELKASDASKTAFAMNLAQHRDLDEAGCDWGLDHVVSFFRGVCIAVQFSHRKEIRHRDIKPKNVLVSSALTPILTDFDIADLMFKRTLSVAAHGTPTYAAPEQLRGNGSREFNADIYSLGRLLHFLLLKADPPFEDAVPRLDDLGAHPEGLVRIVRKCTMRDPAKRYQTVNDLLADFSRCQSAPKAVGTGPADQVQSSLSPTESGSKDAKSPESIWRKRSFRVVLSLSLSSIVSGLFTAWNSRAPNKDAERPPVLVNVNPTEVQSHTGPNASASTTTPAEQRSITTDNGQVELVAIPAGTFVMGSPMSDSESYDDERPQHEVTVSPFWLGKFEVTNAQYARFLTANPTVKSPDGWTDTMPPAEPVVNVSWDDANAFAHWAGGRLPTEAEWEYAARAGSVESRYGKLDEIAWYGKNSTSHIHSVGELKPNAWGLHDTLGNVWEWCSDRYGPYEKKSLHDPSGPTVGSERVIRGGSWGSDARRVRAAYRGRSDSVYRDGRLGFRLARGQSGSSP